MAYNADQYSDFFRKLASSLPHVQRPTKDDFLNVASGFWERAKIRFKWFTIRSFRKFNSDDISAFISIVLMSQTLWIFVGTTTFVSVIFAIANALGLENFIARSASSYLTSETGVTVIFESAIVPKWTSSKISFKKVYVSRRPNSFPPRRAKDHSTALGYDVSNHPANHRLEDEEDLDLDPDENTNYSQFDLTIDTIDVTLSLWRWLDGRGLVEDASVKGVRGVFDRRSITWDPDNPLVPADFRTKARPGDFDLDRFQVEDMLVTVYQPGDFRPFTMSIFRADLHQFRKQWVLYDILNAENVVGQFDGCLFSLHRPQSIGRTTEMDLKDTDWARMTRIRIDGVNVDHLQRSTANEGPISWITAGKIDAVLDIKFPKGPSDSLQLDALLDEITTAITESLANTAMNPALTLNPALERIPGQRQLAKPPLSAPQDKDATNAAPARTVTVDIDLRFRDVKAQMPIFTNHISYMNNALARPIVAFMNANRTLVPIHCRIVKDIEDFDGAWSVSGLLDEIAIKMYDALAFHVTQANIDRRMRVVGIWSLQKTAAAVLKALRAAFDPLSVQMREAYLYNGPSVWSRMGKEAFGETAGATA
ncbi:mitochondrial distribution and morphology protein family 31/32 [Cylindrobasidium torrendii FP15055 ss-10]|uniref:Mitochondrial distribution and morphology protein family 31/32 n=1 Tax=Cylindrobasidium torrendii FP15055 ss-10 TaxID=1314674 RepID=A0A0D7AW93_9AGAR|nr:mitochondrial distribution and morphology protein family 31/32 [Cylindrobasidium torrendii FP15055 ss-10]